MKKLPVLFSLLLLMLLGSQTAQAGDWHLLANQGAAFAECASHEGVAEWPIGSGQFYLAACFRDGEVDLPGEDAGRYTLGVTPINCSTCIWPFSLDAYGWLLSTSCDSYSDGCVPAAAAKPGNNKGCPTCKAGVKAATVVGEPINTGIGNEFNSRTVYRGTGPFPLEFTSVYNSAGGSGLDRNVDTILGKNRTVNYDRHVRAFTEGAVTTAFLSRPDGQTLHFARNGSSWVADTNLDGILTSTRDGNDVVTSWAYRNDRNETEVFDATGVLQSITSADGFTQTLTYDTSNRIASVRDMAGRQLTFTYNTTNRLTQLALPDGNVLQFFYDTSDNLQTVTYPGGATTNYFYNEQAYTNNTALPHALTREQDEKSNYYATTVYDTKGRAISSFLASNLDRNDVAYTDSSDGSYVGTAVITSPLGKTRTLTFQNVQGRVLPNGYVDSCPGCTSQTKAFNYATSGNVSSISDYAGVVTTYTQDANGLETERIESANNAATKRTTDTTWNTMLRVPTERFVYDSSLAQPGTLKLHEQWTYNTRGQVLTHVRVGANNPSITRTTTFTYCEQADITAGTCPLLGLLTKIDGERTDVVDTTTFAYYAGDDATCSSAPTTCPHRKGDLWKVTNAKGQITTYNVYDGAGRPLQVADANGVVTDLTYTSRGWLSQAAVRGADPNSSSDDAITTIAYEATGTVSKVTVPDGDYLSYTYDTAHRLTDVTDNFGNSAHYTLDAAGNRTAEQSKDVNGTVKQSLSRLFDQLGRLQQSFNAAGQATGFTYDVNDNLVQTTDALSHKTGQTVDVLGRVTQTTQDVGGLAVPTQQQYNTLDQVTQVTDPKGLNTTYTYNGFGDLITLASPDSGSSSYTINAAGQRVTQTDARGVTLTYGYDALNRLTSVTGPTSAQNFTYTYDTAPADCITGETYGLGRLGQMTDESGSTRFCYDRFGHLTRQVQTIGTATQTTRYEYTLAGRLYRVTYPSGAQALYARNTDGQITNVQLTISGVTSTLVSSASYLPFGPLTSLTFGNNRVLTKAFDADYGIDKVSDNATTNPLSEDYALDAVGNVTTMTEQLTASGSTTRTYTYDALDRITGHKNGASTVEGFTYNGTGDRTSKTVGTASTYTYGSTNHWLTNISGIAALTYNAAGDTATLGSAYVFTYDDHNRFRTFTLSGTLVRTYTYNALGQRVLRVVNSQPSASEQFVYDQAGHLLGEYTTSGTRIAEYVWMDDSLVGIIKAHGGATYQYVETDALGTPRAVINPTNNTIVWRWDITQTAFGDHNPINDPDGNGVAYNLGLRYPGQFNDGLDFINYNGFRDYYANSGRYLESDPIGLAGGISTYGYVGGNPLGFADPLGLAPGFRSTNPDCVWVDMFNYIRSNTGWGDKFSPEWEYGNNIVKVPNTFPQEYTYGPHFDTSRADSHVRPSWINDKDIWHSTPPPDYYAYAHTHTMHPYRPGEAGIDFSRPGQPTDRKGTPDLDPNMRTLYGMQYVGGLQFNGPGRPLTPVLHKNNGQSSASLDCTCEKK